jgi:hypothetical protein
MDNQLQITKNSPLSIASEFIKNDSNVDIDKLSKLLDIQERWEKNEAKKAYVEAMAAFKLNPPVIEKDRHVKFQTQKGVTEYKHASLQNVTSTINEALSKHGLTASWSTKQNDSTVTVSCRITHIFGHSEETSLTSGHDNSGNKNPIQALASAISYLERYTLLALTGLATEEMDDDGASTNKPSEKPKEVELSPKQIDFVGKVKILLDEFLDGKETIDENKLRSYMVESSRRNGKPVPDDEKSLSGITQYLTRTEKKPLLETLLKKAS